MKTSWRKLAKWAVDWKAEIIFIVSAMVLASCLARVINLAGGFSAAFDNSIFLLSEKVFFDFLALPALIGAAICFVRFAGLISHQRISRTLSLMSLMSVPCFVWGLLGSRIVTFYFPIIFVSVVVLSALIDFRKLMAIFRS